MTAILRNWALRPAASNDELLRNAFLNVLAESRDLPPDEKLIMYDACDGEVRAPLAEVFRKRLDARRNTKPKKSDDQRFVCTPFNPNGFHFGKIRNDKERLVKLQLSSGRYDMLTNKFPLFPKHMLLVANALVPQQMTAAHLSAVTELIGSTAGFCAYFNSWCASASVNHFHCHVIDEQPPVAQLPLVSGPVVAGTRCLQPQGFPGFCFVRAQTQTPRCCPPLRHRRGPAQPWLYAPITASRAAPLTPLPSDVLLSCAGVSVCRAARGLARDRCDAAGQSAAQPPRDTAARVRLPQAAQPAGALVRAVPGDGRRPRAHRLLHRLHAGPL
jgi:hypothetical protein